MADLNTLANFSYRYRAASNYVGGAANAIAFGTSWTDDAGANAWGGNIPANIDRRGRVQISGIRANTGGIALQPQKVGVGTALNCRNMGLVWVGQWPCGSMGTDNRPLLWIGTNGGGGHIVLRQNSDGDVAISRQANASVQTFTGLRIPAGPTAILFDSGAGGTWAKVLGQAAVTGAVSNGAANNNWLGLYGDPAGSGTQRSWCVTDELAFFTASGSVKNNAAAIEADIISRYGLTEPTVGHVLCIGTSLGCGCYHGLGVSWPGEVGAALPDWFVKNNSREGQTFAQALTDIAVLGTASGDRPLGTSMPEVIIVELGANEVNTSTALATLKANAEAFISALRTAKPDAEIVVCTVVVISTTAAKNTIRTGYNSWLLAGGLSAYGVTVADIASYDATFTPASNTDADVNTCTGTANFTTTDLANTVGAGDHVHWSLAGFNRLYPAFVTAAEEAAERATATGRDLHPYRPSMYRRWL